MMTEKPVSAGNDAARPARSGPGAVELALLALAVTVIGTLVAFVLAGQPPLIGIDDAAITRNYAENLANGHGIVYYAGGERVEGGTAFLWTTLLAVLYALLPVLPGHGPELPIIVLSTALTAGAVFCTLALASRLAEDIAVSARIAVGVTALGLLALPGYFFWAAISMMEVALWSALLLLLIWRLTRLVRPDAVDRDHWIVVAAALLPLTRPEGVAVTVGLLAGTALLCWRLPRVLVVAVGAALLSFTALTAFRLAYFGFPVPNTFYAKVSSDHVQDLVDGLKYLFSFVTGFPFAEILLLAWGLAALAVVLRLRSAPRGRPLLIPAAGLFGMLATYAFLGGDHFAYWRFYEPVLPLLALIVGLASAAAWPQVATFASRPVRAVLMAAVAGTWLGISYGDYRQARFDLVKEITLVEQGMEYGRVANGLVPRPTLAVVPAGGVALTYEGPVLDLLGLNWVAMAHAEAEKVGVRSHASFNKKVFWQHPPDLFVEFNRDCSMAFFEIQPAEISVLKGLQHDARFREAFTPLRLLHDGGCWRAYALRSWLAETESDILAPVDWDSVEAPRAPDA